MIIMIIIITHKLLWDFEIQTDHQISTRRPHLIIIYGTLWNMKVIIIPIGIGALGTVTKRLVQRVENLEIRGRGETIQTNILLKTARMPEKSSGHLRRLAVLSVKKPSANVVVKNSQKRTNDNNNKSLKNIFQLMNMDDISSCLQKTKKKKKNCSL